MKIEELLKTIEEFPYGELELKRFIQRLAGGNPTQKDLDDLGNCVWEYPKLVKFAAWVKEHRRSSLNKDSRTVIDDLLEELEKDDLR